jgi:uncharacterized membrane protein
MKKIILSICGLSFFYNHIAKADVIMPGQAFDNTSATDQNFRIIVFIFLAIVIGILCFISYKYLKKIKRSYEDNKPQIGPSDKSH